MKHTQSAIKITVLLLIVAAASIAPAAANPITDIQNQLSSLIQTFKNMINPLSWFMPANQITVTDTGINYYVSISGESWRADLKDGAGNLISSQSGSSYGWHTFPRPPAGTYYLSIWCFYGSSSCTSNNVETVVVPQLSAPSPTTTTPAPTAPPAPTASATASATDAPTVTPPAAPVINFIPEPIATAAGVKQSPSFDAASAVLAIFGLFVTTILARRNQK